MIRDPFCPSCGTAFPEGVGFPRTCANCQTTRWANPIPVCVVLVPVDTANGETGLLVVRRAIEPKRGLLALTGGFLEDHETWQEGGAREVREETGLRVEPNTLTPLWFTSTTPRPNRVLLFSVAAPVSHARLGAFTPSSESSERGLIFGLDGLDALFAFPLHVEAVRRYFDARGGGAHPARFTPC